MSRTTIDFGIDLGTTNSVIAVANEGRIEIIKNDGQQITPSLVYIDKRGKVLRGLPALSALDHPKTSADVQSEFKREMGQKVQRHFHAAGKSMSPEELSAEILQVLREAAAERTGQQPAAAVITVPAMFELPQNDATARAAKLAGFENSVLLQEPVAAATAYGFESDADRTHWLVYDLGGGTFDASIIAVRDNQLSVVKHAGDNYLGGADFDRQIVDRVIVPQLQEAYDLSRLSRSEIMNNRVARGRYAKIKRVAEEIKKSLSRQDSESLFREDVFEDDSGEPVDIDIKLKRTDFEDLIRTHVQKSLDITSQLIQDSGLKPGDIEKVLLVGGSTYVPYVQKQVATLGIQADRSMDPLTVVAYGAAVFASSQRLPKDMVAAAPVSAGTAKLALEYEPVGKNINPPVMGKLEVDGSAPAAGTSVTIKRTTDEGWTSGDLPVDAKGVFFTNVSLRETGQSVFQITARDSSGNALECSPDNFAITYGMSVAKASLPQAISVGLANGRAEVLLPAGTSLPNTSEVYRRKTTRDLRLNSTDEIHIPFMSGDQPESEHNLIGTIWKLAGTSISRDLPKGSDIELTVEVDRSGTSTAYLTIPLLDEQFVVKQDSDLEHETPEVMRERLDILEQRIDAIEAKPTSARSPSVDNLVRKLNSSETIRHIKEKIDHWGHGDHVAAGQARRELVELSKRIKTIEDLLEWPTKLADYEEAKGDVRKAVHEYGDAEERHLLQQLTEEADRAVAAEDPRMLAKAIERIETLGHVLKRRDPRFLAGMLHYLASEEENFIDRRRGQALLQEGALALKRNDQESVGSIISELIRLLPPDAGDRVNSAVRADII